MNNLESFDHLSNWRSTIFNYIGESDKSDFPIFVVGNKIDLETRVVTEKRAKTWCQENRVTYFEASAKESVFVEEVFSSIAGLGINRVETPSNGNLSELTNSNILPNDKEQTDEKSKCPC